jgi:hypothetical protein
LSKGFKPFVDKAGQSGVTLFPLGRDSINLFSDFGLHLCNGIKLYSNFLLRRRTSCRDKLLQYGHLLLKHVVRLSQLIKP